MAKQKKIEPLAGEELIRKVKELGNLSKEEKAKVCGYYSIAKNGCERVNMMQFLKALIDAEGIELDGTGRDNGDEERSASGQSTVRSNESIDSNKIVTVKRATKSTAKPQLLSQPVQQSEEQQLEIEQPEQPEQPEQLEQPDLVVYLEPLVEPIREESVYGSGWSLAQLMNEFGGR